MNAGELFDRIVAKTVYAEKDARDLVFRLLRVIEYIHSRGVVSLRFAITVAVLPLVENMMLTTSSAFYCCLTDAP